MHYRLTVCLFVQVVIPEAVVQNCELLAKTTTVKM